MVGATSYSTLLVERRGDGVSWIKLNRPKVFNAVNMKMLSELIEAVKELDADKAVKVIVLCGQGKHFCAGLDFSAFMTIAQELADPTLCPGQARNRLMQTIRFMQEACTVFESCSKPTIAAIHNACVGAGMDLTTACDIRICDADASFCVKEIDLAITADMGTLQRLPRLIGEGRARELALTARTITADTALSYGLVTEVVSRQGAKGKEQIATRASDLAKEIAGKSTLAATGTKRVMVWGMGKTIADGLEYVTANNGALLYSQDLQRRSGAPQGTLKGGTHYILEKAPALHSS